MKKTTKEKILDFIKNQSKITPSEISDKFLISRVMTHKYLKILLNDNLIEKEGSAPRVFYKIKKQEDYFKNKNYVFLDSEKEILENNFLYITPVGKRLEGEDAFIVWCNERDFDISKKIKEYIKILKKYKRNKENNFYDATGKIKDSFKKVCVDKMLYVDFNSIEIFGKTKLGQMVLYAKQNQDRKEMKKISKIIKDRINDFVKKEKFDSIIYIPPTVKREYQFMKFLEKDLNINLPKIKVIKTINDIAVPQKTLRKISDRQKNAQATFEVIDKIKFKKTLIIDDAVGSGSTINEVACKIKTKGLSKKIIGISLVGSLNGFEIISEV